MKSASSCLIPMGMMACLATSRLTNPNVGGKNHEIVRPGKDSKKTAVLGMVERGGNFMTHIVTDARRATLILLIKKHVEKGARVSTDQLHAYKVLGGAGYDHKSVNHGDMEWVRGDTHSNSIEGVWSRLKNSIRGTHINVSRKHLPKYLGEFEYRYNMRGNPEAMFSRLLLSFQPCEARGHRIPSCSPL